MKKSHRTLTGLGEVSLVVRFVLDSIQSKSHKFNDVQHPRQVTRPGGWRASGSADGDDRGLTGSATTSRSGIPDLAAVPEV